MDVPLLEFGVLTESEKQFAEIGYTIEQVKELRDRKRRTHGNRRLHDRMSKREFRQLNPWKFSKPAPSAGDVSYLLDDKMNSKNDQNLNLQLPPSIVPVGMEVKEEHFMLPEDHERYRKCFDSRKKLWQVTKFPPERPSGRQDAILLEQWLRQSLEHTNNCNVANRKDPSAVPSDPSQVLTSSILLAAMHEALRQVFTHCLERGRVMMFLWHTFILDWERQLRELRRENGLLRQCVTQAEVMTDVICQEYEQRLHSLQEETQKSVEYAVIQRKEFEALHQVYHEIMFRSKMPTPSFNFDGRKTETERETGGNGTSIPDSMISADVALSASEKLDTSSGDPFAAMRSVLLHQEKLTSTLSTHLSGEEMVRIMMHKVETKNTQTVSRKIGKDREVTALEKEIDFDLGITDREKTKLQHDKWKKCILLHLIMGGSIAFFQSRTKPSNINFAFYPLLDTFKSLRLPSYASTCSQTRREIVEKPKPLIVFKERHVVETAEKHQQAGQSYQLAFDELLLQSKYTQTGGSGFSHAIRKGVNSRKDNSGGNFEESHGISPSKRIGAAARSISMSHKRNSIVPSPVRASSPMISAGTMTIPEPSETKHRSANCGIFSISAIDIVEVVDADIAPSKAVVAALTAAQRIRNAVEMSVAIQVESLCRPTEHSETQTNASESVERASREQCIAQMMENIDLVDEEEEDPVSPCAIERNKFPTRAMRAESIETVTTVCITEQADVPQSSSSVELSGMTSEYRGVMDQLTATDSVEVSEMSTQMERIVLCDMETAAYSDGIKEDPRTDCSRLTEKDSLIVCLESTQTSFEESDNMGNPAIENGQVSFYSHPSGFRKTKSPRLLFNTPQNSSHELQILPTISSTGALEVGEMTSPALQIASRKQPSPPIAGITNTRLGNNAAAVTLSAPLVFPSTTRHIPGKWNASSTIMASVDEIPEWTTVSGDNLTAGNRLPPVSEKTLPASTMRPTAPIRRARVPRSGDTSSQVTSSSVVRKMTFMRPFELIKRSINGTSPDFSFVEKEKHVDMSYGALLQAILDSGLEIGKLECLKSVGSTSKTIFHIYFDKLSRRDESVSARSSSVAQAVHDYFLSKYGLKNLAIPHIVNTIYSAYRYAGTNARCRLFYLLLTEDEALPRATFDRLLDLWMATRKRFVAHATEQYLPLAVIHDCLPKNWPHQELALLTDELIPALATVTEANRIDVDILFETMLLYCLESESSPNSYPESAMLLRVREAVQDSIFPIGSTTIIQPQSARSSSRISSLNHFQNISHLRSGAMSHR